MVGRERGRGVGGRERERGGGEREVERGGERERDRGLLERERGGVWWRGVRVTHGQAWEDREACVKGRVGCEERTQAGWEG